MRSCQETSRLFSESLERKLAFRERIGLWMHLQMCNMCRGFSQHLKLLRDASQFYAEEVEHDQQVTAMPAEVRARIRENLARHEP